MRFVVLILLTAICGSVASQVLSGKALAVAPGLLVTNQQVFAESNFIGVIAEAERHTQKASPPVTGKDVHSQLVRVGVASPLTGPLSYIGVDIRNGVQLAIEETNKANVLIGGKSVQFVMVAEDDQADSNRAITAAQSLVDSKVVGVVGHFNSGASIPASKIYAAAGIPQISPSSTSPDYTRHGYKTTFRVIAHDDQQGPILGRYALNRLKAKSIAVIDDGTAYGRGLAGSFVHTVNAGGANVVVWESTTDQETNFKTVLSRIKGEAPDLIMFGGIDPQAAQIKRQMAELGIKAGFIGGDGMQTLNFINIAGDSAEGAMASIPGLPLDAMPRGETFRAKYRARFNAEVELFSPMSYDAAMVFIKATLRSGLTDPARFLSEVAKTNYNGVIGPISFDDNGNLKNGTITIYVVRRGRWEPLETIAVSNQ